MKGQAQIADYKKNMIAINKRGMADQYWLLPTKIGLIHIEVEYKSGDAVQSPEQKRWQKIIKNKGGHFILARTPEQTLKELLTICSQINKLL